MQYNLGEIKLKIDSLPQSANKNVPNSNHSANWFGFRYRQCTRPSTQTICVWGKSEIAMIYINRIETSQNDKLKKKKYLINS